MLLSDVADEQVVKGTAAEISFQFVDQHGDAAAPSGSPTVTVTNSAGTALHTDEAASGTSTDPRTYTLDVADTATVDRLTAVWSDDGTAVGTTIVDVIGTTLISADEFQAREPKVTYDETAFRRARREVDDMFRRVCMRSFVPRFTIERLDAPGRYTNRLSLRYPQLERVAWAEDEDETAITGATSVTPNESGIAVMDDNYWPCGGRITIGYEHGYRRPPDDVVGAAATAIRAKIADGRSSIPARATQMADPTGATINLATPGLGPFTTGIPEVDEVLSAYRWNPPVVA